MKLELITKQNVYLQKIIKTELSSKINKLYMRNSSIFTNNAKSFIF